jgi:hypothetical protein
MVSGKIFIQILPSDSKKIVGSSKYAYFSVHSADQQYQAVAVRRTLYSTLNTTMQWKDTSYISDVIYYVFR